MSSSFRCALCAFLAAMALLAGEPDGDFVEPPVVSVPVMSREQARDWETRIRWSAGMYGFHAYAPGQRKILTLLPVEARFWIGTDGENLYLSASCETGPEGVLARARKGYSSLACLDDSFEFVIVPRPDDEVPDIYHVIVGKSGGYYTRAMKNNSQVVWKPEISMQGGVRDGVWHSTTVLPLKLFGIENLTDGQEIGLRFCRNWRRMAQAFGGRNGVQSSWNQNTAAFFTGDRIPRVVFRKNSLVVHVESLRDGEKMSPVVSVFNPSAREEPVKVDCLIRPALSQPFPFQYSGLLGAGECRRFEIPALRVSPEENLNTRLVVTGKEGGLVYRRCFSWQGRIPQERFAPAAGEQDKLSLKYAYYPRTDRMFLQIHLDGLGEKAGQITGFVAEVTAGDGQRVAELRITRKGKGIVEHLWQLPSLREFTKKRNPSGRYQLKLTAEGLPGISVARTFERKVFDWEDSSVGTRRMVLPPFLPLHVSGPDRLSVVMRDYDMDQLGLFRQVTADGHALLQDGGMRLEAVKDGRRERLTGVRKQLRQDDCEAVFASEISAGALRGHAVSTMEYDGVMKYELTLEKGCKVDSLRLVIPLKNAEMPLMHACADGLRINYGGYVPAGEGCVWDGSKAARIDLATTYVPYIWVGAEGPGFCVFGDNDKGWHADRKTPVQKLIRHGDTLELVLELIAAPLELKEDRRIVLGFQATPVKPMPEDWRTTVVWATPSRGVRPYLTRCVTMLANSAPIGGVSPSDDLFPRDFDLSLWHTYAQIRRSGVIPDGYLEKWLAGYRNRDRRDYYHRAIRHALYRMKEAGTQNPITFYTNARGMRTDISEAVTFQDEWFKEDFQGMRERPAEYGESKSYSVDPVESFRDFAAGWYRTMITTGATDNIYFDDVFLSSNYDFSGDQDTYRLTDGQLQPSVGLFNMRELLRRAATVQAELGRPSWNIAHMTNTQIAPVLSFVRMNLDWEDHSGLQPYQLRYTREYLRAVSIGRQTGNIPGALAMIDSKGEPVAVAACIRSGVGVALTHEISYGIYESQTDAYWSIRQKMYEMGYGTDKAVTRNYWERDYPLSISGETSSLLVFNRQGEAIAIVCNYGEGGRKTMRCALDEMGMKDGFRAVNLEDGSPLIVQGNAVEFSLKPYDFIAIKLTKL